MESNQLWTILVGVAISLFVAGAHENIIPVVRTDLPRCQANAVCANVFRTNTSYGVYQARSILNCRCNLDSEAGGCPFLSPNDNNAVFQSLRNQEVLCTSVRDLPLCGENDIARRKMSDMTGRIYFAVYCRCPYHNRPLDMVNRMKATLPARYSGYVCNQG